MPLSLELNSSSAVDRRPPSSIIRWHSPSPRACTAVVSQVQNPCRTTNCRLQTNTKNATRPFTRNYIIYTSRTVNGRAGCHTRQLRLARRPLSRLDLLTPERVEPHPPVSRHDASVRSGGSRRPQRQQRDDRDRISAAIETACSGWSGPRLPPLGATTRPWTVDAAALNLMQCEPMHTRSVTQD